ncbi:MAG: YCF48-related protein [bacterium]
MMKIIWIIIIFSTIINKVNCGWIEKDLGLSVFTVLSDVTFSDENNGWIVGSSGIILHTSDGGDTWSEQISNTKEVLLKVFFLNNDKGWIASSDKILKTTDGGDTWTSCQTDVCYGINSIYMLDDNNGWAVGEGGWIYKTTDGYNWNKIQGSINLDLNDLDFATKDKGIIVGSFGDLQYIINGEYQHSMSIISSDDRYQSIFFVDSLYGWIAGYNKNLASTSPDRCILLRSSDAGENWDYISYAPSSSFRDIFFIDREEGLIVAADGTIFYTNDGGITLSKQFFVPNVFWNGICFTTDKIGWAVGTLGTLAYYDESIGIDDYTNNSFKTCIYPNPVEDNVSINISIEQKCIVKIEIYDSFGRLINEIYKNSLSAGEIFINSNLSYLNNGIYFIKLSTGDKFELIKFIKI